jgi:integrase
MRNAQTRDAQNCADLAQGLAFTGCRIAESAQIEWRHLNFETGEILVKGDPEEATKNGEIRRIPMIAQARELFGNMRQGRADEPPTAKVFRVNECQHSMDSAGKKIGMPRITHHDLRHFFATVSIESGVDIPTVSRWLGHKDGGALAMRTYGHLRREHSLAQAQKVSFAPVAAAA